MKQTKSFLAIAAIFFMSFLFAMPVFAFTMRTGNEAVLPKGETVEGTLVIAGQAVTIDGDVNGDVICVGQTVTITGSVSGDVVCVGQNITVTNSVSGSVRAAGQAVNIGGKVGRNVTVAGQSVKSDSQIQGDMLFAAQTASIAGQVVKGITGAANSIIVSGNVGGDAQFRDLNLTVKSSSTIAGALAYTSSNDAVLESGSQIVKGVQRSVPPANSKKSFLSRPQESVQQKIFDKIRGLAIYLVVALLLVFFFKNQVLKAADSMLAKPGRSFGAGLLLLILVPIATIAVAITVIGIPVALIAVMLYILAIFFSRIFTAIAIGRKLVQNYYKSKQNSLMVQTLIGIVGLWILFAIPVIGSILSFVSVIWGLGGIYYMFKKDKAAIAI